MAELSKEDLIKIWERAVDTQMHFNEMSVKSRQLGLTFIAGALGVAIVLLGQGKDMWLPVLHVCGVELGIHLAVLVVAGAIIAVRAVKRLDLGVYHKMLRGAVSFGEDLERNSLAPLLGLNFGMTQAISHFSRHEDAKIEIQNGKNVYQGSSKLTAYHKIRYFYRLTTISLIVIALGALVITNLSHNLEAK